MRKISKLFFVITALTFALSFGVVSNSPTAYATSGGGEGRCSDFSEASDREMCNDQYNECQAATGGNNCMERAVEYTQENGTQAPEGEPDVCTAGALGWIVCPAIDFLATMNDAAYAAVEALLVVNPVALENGGPLFQTWERFRDIANALFVVAILIIVFSQATSLGLSSYGVKKLLPRVIAAAILVNISFFLCQIAVDISNIVGVSIHSLFESFYSDNDVDIDAISFSSLITGILAGGALWGVGAVALGSGGIMAAMASLLPFLVTALFAVITALVVLIARQVIIILLVALSPLAFVALILPNTQKYFQMWQNTITTMLVMFPLVAALFAGSKLAANIVLTSPTSDADGGISLFSAIAAICMMFIPLFAVPFIVKFSGGTLGRLVGMVNNPNKGPFDKLRKRAEETRDLAQNRARTRALGSEKGRNPFTFAGQVKRNNARNYKNKLAKGIYEEAEQEDIARRAFSRENPEAAKKFATKMAGSDNPAYVSAVQASAKSTADKLDRESAQRREVLIRAQHDPRELLGEAEKGYVRSLGGKAPIRDKSGNIVDYDSKNGIPDAAAARAYQQIMLTGGSKGIQTLASAIDSAEKQKLFTDSKGGATEVSSVLRGELNSAGLKPKDNALASWAFTNKTLETLQTSASTYKTLTDTEFVGQSPANIKAALEAKAISVERAQAMLDNKNLATIFGPDKRGEVQKALAGGKLLTDAQMAQQGNSGPSGPPPAGPATGGSSGPSGPAPSGGSGGSPAAPRGPSGPPPAAPLGYAPAPQATVAPTPPAPQVVQAAPIQQTPMPAAPARNLPPAQPAQQATTASDVSRYTAPYSQNDLQAMGAGGIRTIIREVPQGTQGLSNADIAKIINATKDQNQAEMQDINQELRMERNRRRGGFDPTSGPKNPLP